MRVGQAVVDESSSQASQDCGISTDPALPVEDEAAMCDLSYEDPTGTEPAVSHGLLLASVLDAVADEHQLMVRASWP